MVVLPGSGSGWVSILRMLRLLFHPTGMCKMPGQGVLVGLAKSLEKLSSGFRINRAADDAAGLAISEGLRTQVGGNRQAVRNAQDGISLVQTAEGALNEVHSILQRMRVLAVQGATDSNSPEARNNIDTELNQLRDELERIGNVTNFNGTQLLDGSASGPGALKFQVGANGDQNNRITVDLKDADVTKISQFRQEQEVSNARAAQTAKLGQKKKYLLNIEGKTITIDLSAKANPTDADVTDALQKGLQEANFEGYIRGGSAETAEFDMKDVDDATKASAGTYTLTINNKEYKYDAAAGKTGADLHSIVEGLNEDLKRKGADYKLVENGKKIKLVAGESVKNTQVDFALTTTATGDAKTAAEAMKGKVGFASGKGFEFAVKDKKITFARADGKNMDVDLAHSLTELGNTPGTDDKHLDLNAFSEYKDGVATVDANGTKLTTKSQVNSLTVKDHDTAQNLIRVLDQKIQSVSTARSNLGAVQNRFEHTITNLNVAVENLAASESRVRDTDMAQEMMQFTRNQILSQAGTSMLAQANQVPQGVLSLLR
ncbi:flagellin [Mobiluncus mulieris]|uniref:flagellin N-terminal helical domain-containing protein n=1 Tax=Mobiluncus mulieris TaxID=2052 RepID=UPI0021E35D27|nr:flagellin [Mobiluncus mulieris]MCU9974398.1 flagellin [Mobiluncus mulieris]